MHLGNLKRPPGEPNLCPTMWGQCVGAVLWAHPSYVPSRLPFLHFPVSEGSDPGLYEYLQTPWGLAPLMAWCVQELVHVEKLDHVWGWIIQELGHVCELDFVGARLLGSWIV